MGKKRKGIQRVFYARLRVHVKTTPNIIEQNIFKQDIQVKITNPHQKRFRVEENVGKCQKQQPKDLKFLHVWTDSIAHAYQADILTNPCVNIYGSPFQAPNMDSLCLRQRCKTPHFFQEVVLDSTSHTFCQELFFCTIIDPLWSGGVI